MESLYSVNRAQGRGKGGLVTDLSSDLSSSIDDSSLRVLSVNQIMGCSTNKAIFLRLLSNIC